MAVTEEKLKSMGNVEILPRCKAEYEFDKRFEKTRANQLIARVTSVRYFKHYSGATKETGVWTEINPKDMVDI